MRLIEINRNGQLRLSSPPKTPPYAILSHTWGNDEEEVSYQDMLAGGGRDKAGYKKIAFCALQAQRDGLSHIWIDTCCINKSDSTELSEAINSMFRFYAGAEKCYVYLPDVLAESDGWMEDFASSRWFTRGWTLQELLAPRTVEFFSEDGGQIGTRNSLERQIVEITRLPAAVLRGKPFAEFTTEERFQWQEGRQTKKEEDSVYSLLGVFGVFLPIIYGEGRKHARKRLNSAINENSSDDEDGDFAVTFNLTNSLGLDMFVPRPKERREMHAILLGKGTNKTVVLYGGEGVGKTQLAINFATQYRTSYSAVFWFNASNTATLRVSFADVARQIYRDHPTVNVLCTLETGGQLDALVDAVKAWMSLPDDTQWLAIYDGYDPGAVELRKFLPEKSSGSIIVTTQSAEVNLGQQIEVGKLETVHSRLAVLSSTSGRRYLSHDDNAAQLASELDGSPLVLAAAGSCLQHGGIEIDEYLRRYESSRARLLPPISDDKSMLFALWQTSYDHILQKFPMSAKLLTLWAYFDHQDLWFELLCHSGGPEWIHELTDDRLKFHEAIRVLCDFGFARRDSSVEEIVECRGYSIHRSIHAWTKQVLNDKWDVETAWFAMWCVASHVPDASTTKSWLVERRLLTHASYCMRNASSDAKGDHNSSWAYQQFGNLFWQQGQLAEAAEAYQRALHGDEEATRTDNTSTATMLTTLQYLGHVYRDKGELQEAEAVYERALQGFRNDNDPRAWPTAIQLGDVYKAQGQLLDAKKIYQQTALSLGEEEVQAKLETTNKLGSIYREQSMLDHAESCLSEALLESDKILGEEHLVTLEIVDSLANVYAAMAGSKIERWVEQAKSKDFGAMYQRVLDVRERTLGPENLLTLDAMCSMSKFYVDHAIGKPGRWNPDDAALEMYHRALRGKERVLGAYHPSTADTCVAIGDIYAAHWSEEKAVKMYEQALAAREKAFGKCDLLTLTVVSKLFATTKGDSRLNWKLEYAQQIMDGFGSGVEVHDRLVPEILGWLGRYYNFEGNHDKAEKMFQQAIEIFTERFGAQDRSMHKAVLALADFYRVHHRYDEAAELLRRELDDCEQTQGLYGDGTLDTMSAFEILYKSQGETAKAKEMFDERMRRRNEAARKRNEESLQLQREKQRKMGEEGR